MAAKSGEVKACNRVGRESVIIRCPKAYSIELPARTSQNFCERLAASSRQRTEMDPICWIVCGPVSGGASPGVWPASPLQRVSRGHETSYGFGFLLVLFVLSPSQRRFERERFRCVIAQHRPPMVCGSRGPDGAALSGKS